MTENEKGQYIRKLVSESVALGELNARRYDQPQEDRLRKKFISIWTRQLGITPKIIEALHAKKLITEYKITDSPNAAKYYSKCEIQKALLTEGILTGFGGRFPEMAFTNN